MSDSCFLNNSPLEQIHEIITWARENVNELITDMPLTEIVTSVKEGIGTPPERHCSAGRFRLNVRRDSGGFRPVKSLVGMNEKTTLKTWIIMETPVVGVGFLVALIISFFA